MSFSGFVDTCFIVDLDLFVSFVGGHLILFA